MELNEAQNLLRDHLSNYTYQSSQPGVGKRGLMKHHIDSMVESIAPLLLDSYQHGFNEGLDEARSEGYDEGLVANE